MVEDQLLPPCKHHSITLAFGKPDAVLTATGEVT
jgi:hypothetical protein